MMKHFNNRFYSVLILTAILMVSVTQLMAQQELPRASQKASISQRIGITDITVAYHSPAVNGRKVWDGIVPFGQVWRSGANNNTTFTVTHDVKINGQALPAGTYGLHMIPGKTEFTVIFSKNSTSWGSFSYKQEEDALRVNVYTKPATHREWLAYDFTNRGGKSLTTILHWEKLQIPFTIEADVDAIVIGELKGNASSTWQSLVQAVNYCAQNKINLEEAIGWADAAIKLQKNFQTFRAKSAILAAQGKTSDSEYAMDQAVAVADRPFMLNTYGYQLLGAKKLNKAIKIFKINVSKYAENWNVHDSLAEAYAMKGDKKAAKSSYKTALSLLPQDDKSNKDRIQKVIAGL